MYVFLNRTVKKLILKYVISARVYIHMQALTCVISISECKLTTYGETCSMKCGQCKRKKHCHHITGICTRGCKKGFQGERCNKGI